ncbi:MAG TPA: MerR family transcriptional regulator [Xanthobacteraceae bacterium]|nr:MerR family transcriptional regulator [Xanthobacteraceae bacterium]
MSSARYLSASEAARRLAVSVKALRLYEQRGLIVPARTAAGWRAYGPADMARAAQIAALRALGLGLAQIKRALDGEAQDLAPALHRHQASLEARIRDLATAVGKVRDLRASLKAGLPPEVAALKPPAIAFDLPWPWGGERFELHDIKPLNYIIGPLGSGKTRLARRLAQALPGAAFLGLDRSADGAARTSMDAALRSRVERTVLGLVDDGAAASDDLVALVAALESEGPAALVVDMVEQGLNRATQQALIAHLRRRAPGRRALFLLTRSCAILDLAAVGTDEAIILCPANHSPPTRVLPYPGAPGYEAVATCLASPEVRARTEGVIAWRPGVPASA